MGSYFRSEEMTLCQLFLHTDSAYMCVSELGELGVMQFRDTVPDTNAFQRKFVNEVRRCAEMERKLRFLEKEINADDIPMLDTGESPEAPAPREIIDLEATFEKLENELKDVNSNTQQLKKNFLDLIELKHILRKTQGFFDEDDLAENLEASMSDGASRKGSGIQMKDIHDVVTTDTGHGKRIDFVAGVIMRERLPAFERMLWRACRGNVFLKQAEIQDELEDPSTGQKVMKSVFIIFFQGEQLKIRVGKICEAFHASLYPCPDSQVERREMAMGVMNRIEDLTTVLNQTQEHRHRVLVAAAKNICVWSLKVRKIKAIYHILNLFNLDVTAKCMIGEAWCAVNDLDRIHVALRRGMERSNSSVQPILNRVPPARSEKPPTYFRVNKFTAAFQNIVDAYGVAKYREVNPAPFTVITFPFLFAVMFGDAGHGLIMFLFALWMVLSEKKLLAQKSDNEIWNTFFGGRYIILLMGAFSIYTGLIYNDVFSLSLNIFGSSFYPGNYTDADIQHNPMLQLNPDIPSVYVGYPYPFGIDPAWQSSKNKITFTNSIKMKMSIILGVSQMLFGVILSLFNHRFFNDKLSIFTEFIPQVIFLLSIFGYLIVIIFVKWITYDASNSGIAPSLLIGLINMFMFKYDCNKDGSFNPMCPWFSGQQFIQSALVILAVICIPWMLLVKPLILRARHKARKADVIVTKSNTNHNDSDAAEDGVVHHGEESLIQADDDGEDEFDFGETFVHQCIHTIEYCLGCISNTASYLRLWALSLAHAQLSEVLWRMVFRMGLGMGSMVGSVMIFAVFAAWAVLTLAILLLMEGLSAFLHALRLHWVEFQNKFYAGSGEKFIPFSFDHFLEGKEE